MAKRINRVELIEGKLYHYYAGPFSCTMHAVERADSFMAEGTLSYSDDARIVNKSIYIYGEHA